jgi:transcription elongation GreA/GreB family factor
MEDPSMVEGQRLRAEYTTQSQAVRGDFYITDLAKAQQLTDLWESTNQRLAALYIDMQARRQARIDELEKIVPLGPGIAEGTSPADATVLHQAFRAALDEATDASPDERRTMMQDAERFNDDTLRRAVLTAASDVSDVKLIKHWVSLHGNAAQYDELFELRNVIAGNSIWNLKIVQTLGAIPKPQEAWNLQGLEAARELSTREASRRSTSTYYPS